MSSQPPPDAPEIQQAPATVPINRWAKAGYLLLLLAVFLWAPLPVIPFLPLSTTVKVGLASVLFIAVQFAWWGGTVLAGPTAVRQLNSWFRKRCGWKQVKEVPPAEETIPS